GFPVVRAGHRIRSSVAIHVELDSDLDDAVVVPVNRRAVGGHSHIAGPGTHYVAPGNIGVVHASLQAGAFIQLGLVQGDVTVAVVHAGARVCQRVAVRASGTVGLYRTGNRCD